MYEFRGFTQKANKALNLSIESAQNFGHDYIGTEHILLGLIKEGSGVAAAALEECGVTAEVLSPAFSAMSFSASSTILLRSLVPSTNDTPGRLSASSGAVCA